MAVNSIQNFYQFHSPSKTVMDVEDSIVELKRCFLAEKIPINDDNSALHQFEQKLEMVLQCGLKEKPGVFGVRKSYWDYISACFSSSKRQHEGLKLVKSNSELKSPLGRGRALIRYCLMHKCLAETLQICFNDLKTTRDFYSEQYLPLQPKCWLSFFTSLYDLNEIHFDLNPYHSELDVSWPSFARKLFTYPDNQLKSSNNLSSSNLMSSSPKETQQLMDANSELEANVLYLQKRCDTLEKEICTAHRETKDQLVGSVQRMDKTKENDFKVMNNNLHDGTKFRCDSKDCTKHIDLALGLNAEQGEGHCVCISTDQCCCSEHNENLSFIENNKHVLTKTENGSSHINKNESLFLSELLNVPNISNNTTTAVTLERQIVEIDLSVKEHKIANKMLGMDSNEINYTNMYISDSLIVLLLELNELIDHLKNSIDQQTVEPLVFSYVTQLKNIKGALDNAISVELGKMQEFRIQNQNLQEYAYHIKSLAVKQEDLINNLVDKIDYSMKEHKNLYDKICFLRNKLHSYGLLKTQTDSSSDLECSSLPVDKYGTHNGDIYEGSTNCNIEMCGIVLNDSLESVNVLKKSCSKLHTLNVQTANLQLWIDLSHQLNNNLISRVQDQELHMKGITKQLEEANQLLSVMRKQHKKLQSAENVVKYDLQEKRKLLNRLKQQLEATREDCNLVRLKNSESEVEWKNLRKEFVQRHKQTSEESGFIDDKGMEDQTVEPVGIVCEYNSSDNISNNEICFNNCDIDIKQEMKKSRLQMLEEQCQELCSNLINGSKKRKEIDCRLESWCKVIENSHKVSEESDNITVICEIDNVCKNVVEATDNIGTDFNSDVDSSLSSSEIESLNSDCSNIFNSTAVPTDVSPLEPETTDKSFSSDPINCICNENETLHDVCCLIEDSTLPSKDNCKISSEYLKSKEDFISGPVTPLEEIDDCQLKESMIAEGNIQEAKKVVNEEVNHKIMCSAHCKSLLIEPDDTSKRVSQLEEEKRIIVSTYGDLQKENEMILKQLKYQTQQLQLIESTKDQEISALQFQLNSEALKYERALKEFSKNNDNLNDMKQKVSDQEQLILALEEALAEIQVDQESEREHQWEQLEDFRKYNLKDREAMEVEILHLKDDLKMFQRKVIKLLKEKDLMWKKNDYLMHLYKIQTDDRWLDDHEVTECLGCKRQFSFILRKHHCRQCGRIFCNSCSNNWLMTPSSRKQIRVCNECYDEHLKIKKDVRRDSNELYFDGADEEADDDLSYRLNASINSESHLNITDSFVSLPVMKVSDLKKGTHYTSAPELYSPLENQEKVNTRSADDTASSSQIELARNGTSGELLIKANEEAILTIFNQHLTLLQWNFTSTSEAIPISLIYENEYHSNSQQNVIHQSSCETEGVVCLPLPGLYKFHFDNRLRLCPISVMYSYQLQIKKEQGI